MERSGPTKIISFIGKQLKYKVLPPHVLLDICLTAFTIKDIIDARNIIFDAFGETTDYTQPPSLQSRSIRKDLIRIFRCLKDFPCTVGQERSYSNTIKIRAAYARLEGLKLVVSNLRDQLRYSDEMMSGQADPDNDQRQQHAEAPTHVPINQEIQAPPDQEVSINPEHQAEIPMQGVAAERAPATLPELELQALSVNPPLMVGGGIISGINIPAAQVEALIEKPGVSGQAEQPVAKGKQVEDDNLNESFEDEYSSSSSTSTSTSTSTDTSDEDNLPLIPYYGPGPRNGPRIAMELERNRQPPRPIAPPAPRFEGLPTPSSPILIPIPMRPMRQEDLLTDDESPPSETAPSKSKRRRSDRSDHSDRAH